MPTRVATIVQMILMLHVVSSGVITLALNKLPVTKINGRAVDAHHQ